MGSPSLLALKLWGHKVARVGGTLWKDRPGNQIVAHQTLQKSRPITEVTQSAGNLAHHHLL